MAFRTSLAKYLDTLRHSTFGMKNSNPQVKGKIITPRLDNAWWWKDVIVRRSLLEECLGEKYAKAPNAQRGQVN